MESEVLNRLQYTNMVLEELVEQSYDLDKGIEGFVQSCTETLTEILQIKRAGVWLYNEDKTELTATDVFMRTEHEHINGCTRNEEDMPNYFSALSKKRAIIAGDAMNDERTKDSAESYLKPNNIISVLDIPIRSGPEVRGIVSCEALGEGRVWDENDITFAGSVADILSISYEVEHRKAVESERGEIQNAFGRYVSDDLVNEMMANPELLKLGGETRELTVMFTDIRNFTGICEKLNDPALIIALMNEFLTPMSDAIMQSKGTIDKYIGDAIMAFWNAPLDNPGHAKDACRAALAIKECLDPINEAVAKESRETGKEFFELKVGVGINTGMCAVGNMGSKQRFSYSALGDAVNLSHRLEDQTKYYGVSTIIGQSTYDQVEDFACLEIDIIKVKGKNKSTHIYALWGDEEAAESIVFQRLQHAQNKLLDLYRDRDFKKAQAHLTEHLDLYLEHLPKICEIYNGRIQHFLDNPPGDQWDGVYVAPSKKADVG
ncbi:MAG: GAF domain-containing protein [Rickettsiales bacterium]|nr:GAF domain-containing protein [Rickettsiales bacterium]